MNFIGHYYHALEQKGRIAIPSTFREEIGKEVIITRGLEKCLYAFPFSTWEKTIKQVPVHPFGKKTDREWTRLVTHNSFKCDFDNQGRILLNDQLINYANLKKDCVIAGSINYLEIWDKQGYHQYMDQLRQRSEEITERKYE